MNTTSIPTATFPTSWTTQLSTEARIRRSIAGFQVPIFTIPPLYRALGTAISAGHSDAELTALVAAFPGVLAVDLDAVNKAQEVNG